MIGWGEILSAEPIREPVTFLRGLGASAATPSGAVPSFARDVLPLLQAECAVCHGVLGGWDASTYASVVVSGDNGPAVLPGQAEASLLVQELRGTQAVGGIMPPTGPLAPGQIQVIVDWIEAGAPDN